MSGNDVPVVIPQIEGKILLIRGHRVMLDADLATLYGVATKVLVQGVKRNLERFPEDFMFVLSESEFADLRSQTVTSSWGGRRHPPYAFTEQGVAMLSSVLRSDRAVRVNVEIMRTFVRMRQLIGSHAELAEKIGQLERKMKEQGGEIKVIFAAIHTMLNPVKTKKPAIGFRPAKDGKKRDQE